MSKGIVGKEEALRMEEEALAKLQKEKKSTASPASSSSSSASLPKPQLSKTSSAPPGASESRAERDLIVFPETRRPDRDQFRDIDVDKLTNEELEKLLLDENFGAKSSVSRPSLLGFNLSASYPGGHASPFQGAQWGSVLSTPGSNVSTPTHQPAPVFPSAFSKPGSFQNGFAPALPPYLALSGQQPPFVTFTPIQPAAAAAAAMVYPPQAVDPQMAKLFDKIASTSEYLKNGRSSSTEPDSSPGVPASLAPNPPPAGAEPAGMSRFDWLDLDPLTKRKADGEEAPRAGADAPPSGPAGVDPWDAVLESKEDSSPPLKARPPHRRASTDAAVTGSHPLGPPASSSNQVGGA